MKLRPAAWWSPIVFGPALLIGLALVLVVGIVHLVAATLHSGTGWLLDQAIRFGRWAEKKQRGGGEL